MPQTQYAKKPFALEIQNITNLKCIVQKVLFNKAKNGKPYTRIEMEDNKRRKITGVIFDNWNKNVKEGNIITVSGALKTFKTGKHSIDIKQLTLVQPIQQKNTPEKKETPENSKTEQNKENTIKTECKKIADLIQDPVLHSFVINILTKHKEFFTAPGGKIYHDTNQNGLAKHSCDVAKIAIALAKETNANIDIVTAGALLHDLGKVVYAKDFSTKADIINAVTEKLLLQESQQTPVNETILEQLIRIALSHQGSKENGAYIAPKTLEEKIISIANELDIFRKRK